MTDPQVMTLALAIIIPLSMLIYSNSRISEAKEALRAETVTLRETLRAEIAAGFAYVERDPVAQSGSENNQVLRLSSSASTRPGIV